MKSNLKYLYRVVYNDKSIYDQNIDDVSVIDKTKSCYADIKLNDIHYFTLSDGIHSYTLDLSDGGFSINGSNKFYLTTEPLHSFSLVHFRRMTLSLDNTRAYVTNFILGYEAKDNEGKPVVNTITIK
jgi:hypothetical protein